MPKYTPLRSFLQAQVTENFSCTFKEIENELGFKLPPSAYTHRAWWSNNPSNNVMTKEWLAAGFETENVDMEKHCVVFHKIAPPSAPSPSRPSTTSGMSDVTRTFVHSPSTHHPLRGALKGTIRIAIDVDLTLPADPEWGEA